MANLNVKRLERDIEKYIPMIIQREIENEVIKMITITDCELSHDLSYCKVYFTYFGDMDHKEIEKIVNEASPFIRGQISKLIDMRNTPVLKFTYDESIEYAQRIEDKIASLKE